MKTAQEFQEILELMQKFNVVAYKYEGGEITMAPKESKIDLKLKDLSLPAKTKEQEAEELLFHSATR